MAAKCLLLQQKIPTQQQALLIHLTTLHTYSQRFSYGSMPLLEPGITLSSILTGSNFSQRPRHNNTSERQHRVDSKLVQSQQALPAAALPQFQTATTMELTAQLSLEPPPLLVSLTTLGLGSQALPSSHSLSTVLQTRTKLFKLSSM